MTGFLVYRLNGQRDAFLVYQYTSGLFFICILPLLQRGLIFQNGYYIIYKKKQD